MQAAGLFALPADQTGAAQCAMFRPNKILAEPEFKAFAELIFWSEMVGTHQDHTAKEPFFALLLFLCLAHVNSHFPFAAADKAAVSTPEVRRVF